MIGRILDRLGGEAHPLLVVLTAFAFAAVFVLVIIAFGSVVAAQ